MTPRPPSAVVLLVGPVVLACALACAVASGESATENQEAASRSEGAAPAVSSPPPTVVAALPDSMAPGAIAPGAALPDPKPPAVRLPEITATELARQVLDARARTLTPAQRAGVAQVLAAAEQQLDLEVLLILALMAQESSFNPRAVGPRGSLGLMQIRPWVGADIARRYGLAWEGDHSLYEPAFNVRLGTYYFAEMMEMFGHDPLLALAAYNMGPYRVRRLLRQGRDPRPEYVDKVFLHYDAFYDDFRAAGIGWGG